MNRYLWIALVVFSGYGSAQQHKPVQSKPEEAVLAAQQQFVEGMRKKNVTVLNRVIADDFVGIGTGGHAAGKASMLDFPAGPTSFASVTMEDPIVRIFDGGTAVVIGTLTDFDVDLHETVRFTMVYRKRGSDWKLVAGQLVPVLPE